MLWHCYQTLDAVADVGQTELGVIEAVRWRWMEVELEVGTLDEAAVFRIRCPSEPVHLSKELENKLDLRVRAAGYASALGMMAAVDGQGGLRRIGP